MKTTILRTLWTLSALAAYMAAATAAADTRTWNGGGGDGLWSNAQNWNNETLQQGDDLVFAGTGVTANNDTNLTFNSITFSAGGFTLTGNAVTLTSTGNDVVNGTGSNTISLNLSSDAAPGDTQLRFSVANGTTCTVGGTVSGTGGIRKDDDGTLVLSNNANDFSGQALINAGMLRVDAANALGATGAGNQTTIDNNAVLGVHGTNPNAAELIVVESGGGQIESTSTDAGATVYSVTLNGTLTTRTPANRILQLGAPFAGNGNELIHQGLNRLTFINGVGDTDLGDIRIEASAVWFYGDAMPGHGTITLTNAVADNPALTFDRPNHGGASITNPLVVSLAGVSKAAYLQLQAGTDNNVYTMDYSGPINLAAGTVLYVAMTGNASNDIFTVSSDISGGMNQLTPLPRAKTPTTGRAS